ncbi:Ferredoxin-NADP reductase (FNR) [Gracilaria domingensis]|nr:Ferredoxin-NADP reductase (FNR) [Gracilaria domingensis]
MLFFIKVNGDWTRKLYALFKERQGGNWEDVHIHLRGPYGAPAQHVNQYEHVVCISGGIGATPFSSIVKYAHYLILNHTRRGADYCSNSVSAAFTRNQSVRGTPSVPATPPHKSGYTSSQQRSRDASRRISRNQSTSNFPTLARNFSRGMSRSGSRSMSRSASGRLARYDSRVSGPVSRSGSGRIERFHSGTRSPSAQTNDSVGAIIKEQRTNQPYGPAMASTASSSQDLDALSPTLSPTVNSSTGNNSASTSRDNIALTIPGSDGRNGDDDLKRFLESEEESMYARPDDYDEELGNPDAPIPDRRATPVQDVAVSPTRNHQTFEIVKEYDSNQGLFDDDEEEVTSPGLVEGVGRGVVHDNFALDPMDLEAGEWDYENELIGEDQTPSNALNLLGMSFGPGAMMRYMYAAEQKKLRSSMAKASMNLMDDAVDGAFWQDRLLFYLHTVTVNWMLLWVMLVRFAMVCIGAMSMNFQLNQTGLGVFKSHSFNVVDVMLALILAIPVIGAILLEIYMHGLSNFITDGLGNSFDLFVLLPIMAAHLDAAGSGGVAGAEPVSVVADRTHDRFSGDSGAVLQAVACAHQVAGLHLGEQDTRRRHMVNRRAAAADGLEHCSATPVHHETWGQIRTVDDGLREDPAENYLSTTGLGGGVFQPGGTIEEWYGDRGVLLRAGRDGAHGAAGGAERDAEKHPERGAARVRHEAHGARRGAVLRADAERPRRAAHARRGVGRERGGGRRAAGPGRLRLQRAHLGAHRELHLSGTRVYIM